MSNIELKQKLDEKQLSIVQSELENQKKSMVVAYLLWFFLGGAGAHRFYIGKTGSAITMLVLFLLGWATSWLIEIGRASCREREEEVGRRVEAQIEVSVG